MTSLTQTMGSALWYILNLCAFALVIGQIDCLLRTFRDGQSRGARLLAAGNLLLGFCVFVLMMDCAHTRNASAEVRYRAFQQTLFALPWLIVATVEAASAALLIWQLWQGARDRRAHLTSDAIRETVSLLPEGLSVSDTDGKVLLTNLKMNELCRALTGALLSDAKRFWQQIETVGREQDGQYIVKLPQSGQVWMFTKRRLATDEGEFDRIRATDVTGRYRILEALGEKNARLQDIQRRMKTVAERSGDMFVAQEEANARVALHNQLGQVLLMGLQCIEHPERTDARVVRLTTQQMNAFLLGEVKPPAQERTDPVRDAVAAAASISVAVELRGEPDPAIRTLLAQAISECAANAVKYAQGDRLMVAFAPDGRGFTVTNNGNPPKAPIRESGGLKNLKEAAESLGAAVEIGHAPAFMLTIKL